nr:response regulator transcription factor [Mesorhizobium sp.]
MRVLVVEDDEILSNGLAVGLGMSGFSVEVAQTCDEARAGLRAGGFDAVVLDLMLPDGSGLDILSELRSARSILPVLLLTARDAVEDKIAGLDAGADDYLGKPFDLDELAARLRALMRRGAGRASSTLDWRSIVIEPASLTVTQAGCPVRLSRREFSVLHALMERPGVILSKGQIEEKLYGWQEDIESNTVEVHVHHLRAKLGAETIETVRGLGYRMGGTGT